MSEHTHGYCGKHHQKVSLQADCQGCEAEEEIREEYTTQIGELEEQVAEMTAAATEGVAEMRRLVERVAELEAERDTFWRWVDRLQGGKPHDDPEMNWRTYVSALVNHPKSPYNTQGWRKAIKVEGYGND